MTAPTSTHAAALEWHRAGCCVLPARLDGSKAAALDWKKYQHTRPTTEQLQQWFGNGHPGMGIVCGQASGNLEMLELEGRAVAEGQLQQLIDLLTATGLDKLWQQVTTGGYVEWTPGGGMHILYRVDGAPVPGNTKLAQRPARPDEYTEDERRIAATRPDKTFIRVLAETRGEGGWVVVAPSSGPTHPTGRAWTAVFGSPATIPTVTAEQREQLHRAVRCLDRTPAAPEPVSPPRPATPRDSDTLSPGDDFEAKTTWADLLRPHGWTLVYTQGRTSYWRRPGKTTPGISATTGHAGDRDRLYVFSSSTVFDAERPYTLFGAYALLEHGGDHAAAARALRAAGYGSRPALSTTEAAAVADLLPPGTSLNAAPMAAPTEGSGPTPQPSPTASEAVADPDQETLAQIAYARDVAGEVRQLRVRREARRRVDTEEHAATWRVPDYRPSLVEELAIPDEPVSYRVEGLLPTGGNVLLTAQFKAGKTTLGSNLIRALADEEAFLSRFDVEVPDGRIAVFNYEVDERQYRRWLRDIGIRNADRVSVLNLRGYRLPLIHSHIEDWVVKWLVEHEVTVWVADPFARAFVGSGDENSNSDVGVFLDALDVIKERAGVSELILPTHTGRTEMEAGRERARGATRLDDWADVRWILTVDEQKRRFFRASGRDVDVDEEMLTFDPISRRLSLGGWDRREMRNRDVLEEVVMYVRENPGQGVNEIIEGMSKGRTAVSRALKTAIGEGLIVAQDVDHRKRLHYPSGVGGAQ